MSGKKKARNAGRKSSRASFHAPSKSLMVSSVRSRSPERQEVPRQEVAHAAGPPAGFLGPVVLPGQLAPQVLARQRQPLQRRVQRQGGLVAQQRPPRRASPAQEPRDADDRV